MWHNDMDELCGKIFLSELKGSVLFNQTDEDFGNLYLFNDERLSAGSSKAQDVAADSYLILIPVTGDLKVQCPWKKDPTNILVGQVLICRNAQGFGLKLLNPYEQNEVNFLQFRIKASQSAVAPLLKILDFELYEVTNKLIEITPNIGQKERRLPFRISIGQFDGRQEAIYSLHKISGNFFSFVLAGAFEVSGRLLHQGDGLALWNITEVEMEALSNNAVILAIEIF